MSDRPRLLFLAFGFPPAAKSSTYRLREIANQFAALGWEVTVLNAPDAAWEADSGIDGTLMDSVDPSIRVVHAPVERIDLETDIRRFSRQRAADPGRWHRAFRRRSRRDFPEPVFGGWRASIERTVLDLHAETPFDLVVVTCVPYVLLTAAVRLHREHGVPFAIDFRDGWSIDVVGGQVAFEQDSEAGRHEREALELAESLWVVNEPIADHYRRRYPELAAKVHVVRNGFDADSASSSPRPPATPPLRFGYLGTINFSRAALEAVLAAWTEAREVEPLLAGATFEIRGHLGAGPSRRAHPLLEPIIEAAPAGVSYGGPVTKSEVGAVYASWDALVLILIGGGFVTSGKVYEYMASGLPVVSAHASEHDASDLLRDYPLWTGACELDHDRLVAGFREAARLAVEAPAAARQEALAYASRFDRQDLMAPAVRRLVGQVRPS